MKKLLVVLAILVLTLYIGSKRRVFTSVKSPGKTAIDTQVSKEVVYEESVVTQVVSDSLPSVVTVGISKVLSDRDSLGFDPFDQFFSNPGPDTTKIERNIGSGFIVSEDGLIVTNKHVVADLEASYKVLTNDDKKFDVIKVTRDPLNDLAIIKINAHGLKPLKLGDSSHLKLGQLVIAIGTPLGEFKNTVTSGIISGLSRGISTASPFEEFVERLDNVIQTDAAINPGNSGGPLINSSGEAIGVNTAISQGSQNIGFAIPINVVKELINNFQSSNGAIIRPFLGIRYRMIDENAATLNSTPEGAYIVRVVDKSPAEKAGLQEEDIIIEFDGNKISGADNQLLQKYIASKKPGDVVKLKIWRNGKTMEKSIELTNTQ